MKTALFIITASLFSGIVSAQEATVKTTQSATANSKSVNGSASVQTDAKTGNVKNTTAKSAEAAGKVKAEGTTQYQKANGEISSELKGVKQTADQSGKTSVNAASSSNVSTSINNKSNASASSAGNATIAAGKAEGLKGNVNNTTNATIKSAHSTTAATGSEIKQTTGVVKSNVKSADASVKTKTKVATSSSIKTGSTVKSSIKTHPVKVASNLKTNVKVGIK